MSTSDRRLAWALAALALVGCEQDNDQAGQDPSPDAAADARPAVDQAVPDATPADAAAPDAQPADQGLPPDQGPTLCDQACARFAECSVQACPGFSAEDEASLAAACGPICAANPAFGTVVTGADTCDTIVAFGRDQGDADYLRACGPAIPPLEPDGSECPYPCVGDEVCVTGQCVRPDGTCETDYHCRLGVQQCQDGTCRSAQFAECRADAECTGDLQSCYSFSQDPLAPGNCFIGCEEDDTCPPSETCNAQAGVCYYVFCGPGSANGDLFGACDLGARGGTCYPLPEGNANAQGTPGLCLEADGDAALGAPCDAQALARTPENRPVQCAPGGICFGDPDDPRQPGAALDGQGVCTALCDPRALAAPGAPPASTSPRPIGPTTPGFDDARYLGACRCRRLRRPGRRRPLRRGSRLPALRHHHLRGRLCRHRRRRPGRALRREQRLRRRLHLRQQRRPGAGLPPHL
ncbi:MAG: hypothetical protein R3F60_25700 [bacterium]